jgi:hypothetical protein
MYYVPMSSTEQTEPECDSTPSRPVVKDIRVPDAVYYESPVEVLINPPRLPVLKF